ncbi:hypothetical protein [Streptomyces microflavus]
MDPETNAERGMRGAAMVTAFLAAAATAGPTLSPATRAALGRATVQDYPLREEDGPDRDGDPVAMLSSALTDVYHHADGIQTPHGLLGAALMELSTTVSMVPVLQSLGDDGRPGILACTVAALLSYGDEHGVCVHEITDRAYAYWTEEVEEERFMRRRAERHTQ